MNNLDIADAASQQEGMLLDKVKMNGDIADINEYKHLLRNMAEMMKGMVVEGMEQMPLPTLLKNNIKLPEKCLPEIAAEKMMDNFGYYFLQPQGPPQSKQPSSPMGFNVHAVRKDFPVLSRNVHGNKPLIWLDNAATSQKPNQVIDAISDYYRNYNSNVHRAAHQLAAEATDAYEGARQKVQNFMGAASAEEIVFVRGTTEAINLVAQTYGKRYIQPGDEIVISGSSHHANIVPWQMLANEKNAYLKVIPFSDEGDLLLHEYEKLLNPRVKIVAVDHVSNVLGTVNPVKLMTEMAHKNGSVVVIDGAQSSPHFKPQVQDIDCDFYVFSSHKVFGPTGTGVLYGKMAHLKNMPPYQGGGNMIQSVSFEHTVYNPPPYKFEAGTGHIAGAIGLGAALDYVNQIGFDAADHYERDLLAFGMAGLSGLKGVKMIGTSKNKVSVMSFVVDGIANEDMGKWLDSQGIAVRSGHHCAQPTLAHYGLTSSVRPSLAFYNTKEEIEKLILAVDQGIHALKK